MNHKFEPILSTPPPLLRRLWRNINLLTLWLATLSLTHTTRSQGVARVAKVTPTHSCECFLGKKMCRQFLILFCTALMARADCVGNIALSLSEASLVDDDAMRNMRLMSLRKYAIFKTSRYNFEGIFASQNAVQWAKNGFFLAFQVHQFRVGLRSDPAEKHAALCRPYSFEIGSSGRNNPEHFFLAIPMSETRNTQRNIAYTQLVEFRIYMWQQDLLTLALSQLLLNLMPDFILCIQAHHACVDQFSWSSLVL